jgi:Uma2 family endonuclease
MSTQHDTADHGFSATIVPFVAGTPPARRFSVDEYHRMIEAGILGENDRVELLDGWILEMSPIGPPHSTCVSLICSALQERLPSGFVIRAQSPITLENGEPEPDVTVARGNIRDYRDHHPTGPEIALVVEVADTSLEFDRVQKKRQYALAGIPEYWIVNLIDRQLEAFRDPSAIGDYHNRQLIDSDGRIEFLINGACSQQMAVADLLP